MKNKSYPRHGQTPLVRWLLSYHNNYNNKAFFRNKRLIYICPVAKGKNNKMGRTRLIGNLAVGNTQGGRQNLNFFLLASQVGNIYVAKRISTPFSLSLLNNERV